MWRCFVKQKPWHRNEGLLLLLGFCFDLILLVNWSISVNKQVTFNFCFILENIVVYNHTLQTLQEGRRIFSGFAGQPRRDQSASSRQQYLPVLGPARENFEKTSDGGKQSEGPGGDDHFPQTYHEEGLLLWALLQLFWLPKSLANLRVYFHIWNVMDSTMFSRKALFFPSCVWWCINKDRELYWNYPARTGSPFTRAQLLFMYVVGLCGV